MNATGGELAPTKSYWYCIDFIFSNNDFTRYKSTKELPCEIYLDTNEGECEVEKREINKSKQSSGTHFPSNGNNRSYIQFYHKKTVVWVDRIGTCKLSVHNA